MQTRRSDQPGLPALSKTSEKVRIRQKYLDSLQEQQARREDGMRAGLAGEEGDLQRVERGRLGTLGLDYPHHPSQQALETAVARQGFLLDPGPRARMFRHRPNIQSCSSSLYLKKFSMLRYLNIPTREGGVRLPGEGGQGGRTGGFQPYQRRAELFPAPSPCQVSPPAWGGEQGGPVLVPPPHPHRPLPRPRHHDFLYPDQECNNKKSNGKNKRKFLMEIQQM